MELIDKAALVAKIKKLKKHSEQGVQEFGRDGLVSNVLFEQSKISICDKLLSFLDTLEVKEVDLCKDEERIWKDFNMGECCLSKKDLEKISKHFFELGMAASNKAQKGEKL